jgi:sugar phosphate isomerase/epimerase
MDARIAVPLRVGCGIQSDDIPAHRRELLGLPLLEVEDYLDPALADRDQERLPAVVAALADYGGTRVLSGPYIDLNPGSPDALVLEATWRRFAQARRFAAVLGATEIIYLSSFIPIVYLSFYEEGWVRRSIDFWRSYLDDLDPGVTVSLCNTFEFTPEHLVRVVEGVGRPNFRLAFDLGHFLVYAKVDLGDWLGQIAPYCATVYVHSNDGRVDTHDAPYHGRLTSAQMAQVAATLPRGTAFIVKMRDKGTIAASVDWVRRYALPGIDQSGQSPKAHPREC